MIALWCKFENAAAMSIDKIEVSWSRSRSIWVNLCSFSAPPGQPTAYWYGASVSATFFVTCFAAAAAITLLKTVPHAIGLILPLGFLSGIMRAEAITLSVFGWALLVARCPMMC